MEFNFRATDEHASNYIPRSSNVSYFTEQALRAGYSGPDYGHPVASANFLQNPRDAREAYQRELEKERIREEIIADEIVRRRRLEDEVRMELMLEREMFAREAAMRRGGGLSFFPGQMGSQSMPLEPRLPLLLGSGDGQIEERLGMSFEERVGFQAQRRRRMEGVGTLPFRRNQEPRITEISTITERSTPEDKPEGNLSGAKRKAITPPASGTSELPLSGFRKKAKEEWSCAICQVTATSQQGLDDHLQGKKHKSKEAALRAQRTGKNYAIGLFPKKPLNPTKKMEISTSEKPKEVKKSVDLALEVFQNAKESKDTSGGDSELSKKKNNAESVQNKQKKKDPKKFKFWCDMCNVGAYSQKVMNKHNGGKKHAARLQERDPTAVVVLSKGAEAKAKQLEVISTPNVAKAEVKPLEVIFTPTVAEAEVKPPEVISDVEKKHPADNLNQAENVETDLSA